MPTKPTMPEPPTRRPHWLVRGRILVYAALLLLSLVLIRFGRPQSATAGSGGRPHHAAAPAGTSGADSSAD
jgi:hypothetical protein